MQTLPPSSKATRIGIFAGLCWLYICIHLNRQIFAVLAESVKSDLGLSDTSLGALTGSAFSLVYALLGLYFGRVADLANRLALVRLGAVIWSFASLGAAFASQYSGLVAARAGVAAGEAIATAAAISLMAELAGERYRARASSVFFSCAFVGAGAAAILGGAVIGHFRSSVSVVGWRAALVAASLPGLAGAFYISSFRCNTSTTHRAANSRGSAAVTVTLVVASTLAVLAQMRWPPDQAVPAAVLLTIAAAAFWTYWLNESDAAAFSATVGQSSFRWLLLAFAAVLFVDSAASFWLIPYAQRRFGISAAVAGAELGSLMIAGGIAGSLLGGWVADRWRRRAPAGRVWVALVAALAETVAILLAISQADYPAFIVAFCCFCIASGGWTGVAAAIGMDIVPQAHRGTGVAAYFVVTTVLGPGLGAFAAGLLNGALGSVAPSLAACCAAIAIAAVAFVRLGRTLTTSPSQSTKYRE